MTAPTSWADGMQAVHDQAAGVVMVEIVTPGIMASMAGEAVNGDREAFQRLSLAYSFISAARGSTFRKPMLCGCCPRSIRRSPFNLALAIPARDDAKNAIAIGICERCATEPAALLDRAKQAFQKIWPDLRAINVHPQAGRA